MQSVVEKIKKARRSVVCMNAKFRGVEARIFLQMKKIIQYMHNYLIELDHADSIPAKIY